MHFGDWPVPGATALRFYLASGGRANSGRGDGRLGVGKPCGARRTLPLRSQPRCRPSARMTAAGADFPGPWISDRSNPATTFRLHERLLAEPMAIAGPRKWSSRPRPMVRTPTGSSNSWMCTRRIRDERRRRRAARPLPQGLRPAGTAQAEPSVRIRGRHARARATCSCPATASAST